MVPVSMTLSDPDLDFKVQIDEHGNNTISLLQPVVKLQIICLSNLQCNVLVMHSLSDS